MERGGCVYILTSKRNSTLYIGVTSDLLSRMVEHREKKYPKSFSARYNLNKLVYYQAFHSIEEAIDREKQLKAGSRKKKMDLINGLNPDWNDLFDEVQRW
ncbi:MAG: GIY-YIG nuclease family protein [Cyclobacteriaceae bacterium]